MTRANMDRARDWIERAIDAMSDSEESVVRACAAALAAAVQAKGKAIAAAFDPWLVNAPEDQRCLIRNMQAVILAHAADVPEVPS